MICHALFVKRNRDSFGCSKDNEKTMMEKWSSFWEIKTLREMYPKGTRVRLIEMNDSCAPPVGTEGTVFYVDNAASININWDNGCSLSAIYGVDRIEKI